MTPGLPAPPQRRVSPYLRLRVTPTAPTAPRRREHTKSQPQQSRGRRRPRRSAAIEPGVNANSRITETLQVGSHTIEATTYGQGETGGNTNSRISGTLEAGDYTIKVTTYTGGTTGSLTLSLQVRPGVASPGDRPNNSPTNGATGIAVDGSVGTRLMKGPILTNARLTLPWGRRTMLCDNGGEQQPHLEVGEVMAEEALQRAQEAIEGRLRERGSPVKVGVLLRCIRDGEEGIRDIDLREAVWILIGRGTVNLTPDRELVLTQETGAQTAVD